MPAARARWPQRRLGRRGRVTAPPSTVAPAPRRYCAASRSTGAAGARRLARTTGPRRRRRADGHPAHRRPPRRLPHRSEPRGSRGHRAGLRAGPPRRVRDHAPGRCPPEARPGLRRHPRDASPDLGAALPGLAVWDNDLRAHVTSDGRLVAVGGSPMPSPSVPTVVPSLSAGDAIAASYRSVGAAAPSLGDPSRSSSRPDAADALPLGRRRAARALRDAEGRHARVADDRRGEHR